MNLNELTTPEAIEAFLSGTQPVVFSVPDAKAARYRWLEQTLVKWRYHQLTRTEKGTLLHFIRHSAPQI